ncbi:vacuolar protein sorting-associated protein 62 [Colletotrichum plurivorum]|uniref:Vacuolar protein sorting-associated protein 62 n=1 Tax=Colletotrichum plurivorum TaxID=2175906 RepID=A0A8H6JFH6_9PEZI|nr:vacuolar protein sorting-associated protein 62 [Colletotrichum plurivorum]
MADTSSSFRVRRTFGPGFLLAPLIGLLLAFSARAGPAPEPDLRCPEYVARHAPLVWLHSDDPFKPSDLLTHIRHTTPTREDGKSIPDLPPLDLDNLELLNEIRDDGRGEDVFLASNDDPLTYPAWIRGEAPDAEGRVRGATPCVMVLVEKTPRDLDAFYFYFYSFNEGPNITQVLEPINRLVNDTKLDSGWHFGDHVGDWEHNMVRFRDGKPVGIYYSQHMGGSAYDWDDSKVSKADGRPVVYSARGTHANYPAPGHQVHDAAIFDYCDEGQKWDPVLSAYFFRFDADSFTVTRLESPVPSPDDPPASANLTSLFYYAGRWGDAAFPDSDPRQARVPKFGLKRFVPGPNGPRHKHLVRKGLKPNKTRKMSWKEWAVRVFMAWYPCCIRGWRRWVSLGVFVVVLSALVIGIVFGVRKYKTRKYRKLREEEIPLDDWVLEEEALLASSDEDDDLDKPDKNKAR